MKREILFRGKRIEDGKWVFGFYTESYDGRPFIQGFINATNEMWEVQKESVNQFSGFTDSGKHKIFEGDIIENDGVHLAVSYGEDSGAWEATEISGDKDTFSLYEFAISNETWLQGNVYDNNPSQPQS